MLHSHEQERMAIIKNQLIQFANESKVRESWHEADEQGVTVEITGLHLDNAFGANQPPIPEENQEIVVHLNSKNGGILPINLADLLAIASKE